MPLPVTLVIYYETNVTWQPCSRPPPCHPAQRCVRLATASFLAYCSYSICRTPLLPLFARELGRVAPSVIGVIMVASTLTGVVMKLPAGTVSHILGRRTLLVAGALVFVALPFTYLAVSTVLMLVLLRAAHGSATAIFSPVASASLSDIAPGMTHVRMWLSMYSTVQGAGTSLGAGAGRLSDCRGPLRSRVPRHSRTNCRLCPAPGHLDGRKPRS